MDSQLPVSRNLPLFVLIGVNLLPIAGVLLWDWSVFEIVALYWFENVVIGMFNILKILTCSPDSDAVARERIANLETMSKSQRQLAEAHPSQPVSKLFLVPFFTFHYGLFCFVHGVFILTLLGRKGGDFTGNRSPFEGVADKNDEIFIPGTILFILAIIGSHLFSFIVNYIGKGEFRRTTGALLMAAPYGRIIVLHLAILFGAFAVTAFGDSVFMLILLIIGKIIVDSKLHLRSHLKIMRSGSSA